ncbi:hypothetical protein AGMMS49921_01230 [Endomicrobiia bacterium]|nr:hypothetical protein AGMMS49921_01230 [Endomicrobiia bacterium]
MKFKKEDDKSKDGQGEGEGEEQEQEKKKKTMVFDVWIVDKGSNSSSPSSSSPISDPTTCITPENLKTVKLYIRLMVRTAIIQSMLRHHV